MAVYLKRIIINSDTVLLLCSYTPEWKQIAILEFVFANIFAIIGLSFKYLIVFVCVTTSIQCVMFVNFSNRATLQI